MNHDHLPIQAQDKYKEQHDQQQKGCVCVSLFLFPSQGYDGTIDRFTTPDVRLTDKTTGDRLCADCMYRSHSLR
jgi:hypothetical protein